jgi:hypothetical protein
VGYGLDGQGIGVSFPAGVRDCSLLHGFQIDSGVHPASYPVVPEALSPGVKRQGREADYFPLSIAEIKDAWSYISVSPNIFMAQCLIKYVDNFAFTFSGSH